MTASTGGYRRTFSPPTFVVSALSLFGGHRVSAMSGARPVGSLDISAQNNGTVELTNLRVLPEFRRQGLATGLVKTAVQRATLIGAARILLEAHPSEASIQPAALQQAYQKMGFCVVGRSMRGSPIMQRLTGLQQTQVVRPAAQIQPKLSQPKDVFFGQRNNQLQVAQREPAKIMQHPFPNRTGQPFYGAVQRASSLNGQAQSDTNLCWAAVGHMTYDAVKGTTKNEADFVKSHGSRKAKTAYGKNNVADIDEIIGSQSSHNILSASDDSGSFSKAVLTKEMNTKDKPVLLNVNGNHYIAAKGTRKHNGTWQMCIVDPADGVERWEDTRGHGAYVTQVHSTAAGAWYTLTVAYYIS